VRCAVVQADETPVAMLAQHLTSERRLEERRERAAPIAKALHAWLIAQRTFASWMHGSPRSRAQARSRAGAIPK